MINIWIVLHRDGSTSTTGEGRHKRKLLILPNRDDLLLTDQSKLCCWHQNDVDLERSCSRKTPFYPYVRLPLNLFPSYTFIRTSIYFIMTKCILIDWVVHYSSCLRLGYRSRPISCWQALFVCFYRYLLQAQSPSILGNGDGDLDDPSQRFGVRTA